MLKIENITPKKAEYYLSMNTQNRPVNDSRVYEYARVMQAGQWKFNGDTIKVSKSNVLLDGQHKLMAIKKSGVSLPFIVITDLEDDVFSTLDQGMKRTFAQLLSIQGIQNSTRLAAVLYYYQSIKANKNFSEMKSLKLIGKNKLSNQELIDLYNERPDVFELAIVKSKALYHELNRAINQSISGAFFMTFYDVDGPKCIEFFDKLISPEFISKEHPCYVLRSTILRNPKSQPVVFFMYFVKAWNAFIRGTTISRLRYNVNEPIPEILSK
jgi:hypothetical protein